MKTLNSHLEMFASFLCMEDWEKNWMKDLVHEKIRTLENLLEALNCCTSLENTVRNA